MTGHGGIETVSEIVLVVESVLEILSCCQRDFLGCGESVAHHTDGLPLSQADREERTDNKI